MHWVTISQNLFITRSHLRIPWSSFSVLVKQSEFRSVVSLYAKILRFIICHLAQSCFRVQIIRQDSTTNKETPVEIAHKCQPAYSPYIAHTSFIVHLANMQHLITKKFQLFKWRHKKICHYSARDTRKEPPTRGIRKGCRYVRHEICALVVVGSNFYSFSLFIFILWWEIWAIR